MLWLSALMLYLVLKLGMDADPYWGPRFRLCFWSVLAAAAFVQVTGL